MFALYVDWDRRPAPPPLGRRLAASLGITGRPKGGIHALAPGVTAVMRAPARCVELADGVWLLFHGFLQNGEDLARTLRCSATSDAETYAAAWQRWGAACDREAIGEYAATIIDTERLTVHQARAALLGPPVHWFRSHEMLVTASIARAIFASGATSPKIDEQKVADSLLLNYSEAGRNWYEGVERLLVGHHVEHDRSGSRTRRYYDPADVPRIRLVSDADYAEAANALLAEGARRSLRGFERPAIMLSGGLDSQAVAVHALPHLAPDATLLALTGVPEPSWDGIAQANTIGDERAGANSLAACYPRIRCETVDAAGRPFDHHLTAMFLWAGQPPRNTMNLPWIHELHARARECGCDVLLTGAMGNASFSFDGYGLLRALGRQGRLITLLRELIAEYGLSGLASNLRSRMARRGGQAPFPAWSAIDADYAARMDVATRARAACTHVSPRASQLAMWAQATGESGDITQAFETIHGIPVRDPTAYRPLVEFCLGLPEDQFRRGGVRRRLARQMLRGRVADAVIDQTLVGKQAADWHVRLGRDRAALAEELSRLKTAPVQRLDLAKLGGGLAAWPERTPDGAERQLLELALPRAIATARFVRWVEGDNG